MTGLDHKFAQQKVARAMSPSLAAGARTISDTLRCDVITDLGRRKNCLEEPRNDNRALIKSLNRKKKKEKMLPLAQ